MEILNINTLIEAVLVVLLYLYWKFVPNNGQVYLQVKTMEKKVAILSESLEVDRTEMWEHIEGTLKPLTARLSTRIKRAEQADQKDLKQLVGSKKRGGMLAYRNLKK